VENFVGNEPRVAPNACPVSIPSPMPAFGAIGVPQQNQGLSRFDGFAHDALQQSRRVS
jgi:hypothetical protein